MFLYLLKTLFLFSLFQPAISAVDTKNSPEEPIVDIAIIGAGVSGTYCGWRLLEENSASNSDVIRNISIFEATDRIGGRLYTINLPGMPHVPVELGGMRFYPYHQRVNQLVKLLELPTAKFTSEETNNFIYLRGKRFRENDDNYSS